MIMNDKTVAVIGLGQVGRSVLLLLCEHKRRLGLRVFGADNDSNVLKQIASRECSADGYARKYDPAWKADVISLCVPCDRLFEPLRAIIAEIRNQEQRDDGQQTLLSIESTLPNPDVSVLNPTGFDVIVFPHRIAPHERFYDRADAVLRVMGGLTNEALSRGMRFWSRVLGEKRIIPCTWREAVLSKVFENAHRYVEIALAEEIAMAAEQWGVNPWRLRSLINSKWNVEMRMPMEGIGRHCLPKDVEFAAMMPSKGQSLFATAIEVDRQYRKELQERGELHGNQ